MRLRLLAPLSIAALLVSCNDGATPCSRVICTAGRTCNALTGVCERSDGGTTDGGGTDGGDGGTGGGDGGSGACNPACTLPQVCEPSSNTCVACNTNSDCGCPTPICTGDHLCISGLDGGFVQETGESCLSPAPLVFPGCGSSTEFQVDLSMLNDDESGTCTGAMGLGKDAVYRLTVPDGGADVTVTLTPAAGVQAVAYVRADPCETGHELVCQPTNGLQQTFQLKALDAGTFWLVVDSYSSATSGSVDVAVDLSAPTGPSNETCGTALPLDLDGGVVTVDLTNANDDYSGSCNPTLGIAPEVVYLATLTQPADLRFNAGPSSGSSGEAVLYVRSATCGGTELGCQAPVNGFPSVYLRSAPAGQYFVFLEAYDQSLSGSFDLSATATTASPAPANDTCAAPRMIDAPVGLMSVGGSINTAADTDEYTGSCNSQHDSPEEVWQLHVTAPGSYTITVSPSIGSSAQPVAYLRTAPCDFPSVVQPPADSGITVDAGVELLCTTSSGTVTLDVGDYYLYIEGVGLGGSGPTDFSISQ